MDLEQISREFLASYVPRERWKPSQWAALAPRILGDDESAEAGPWKNDRTPYLVQIMDLLASPIEELVVLKGAQIGYSEAARNLIGYWVDLDPGPILVVLPDQKSAEDWREERLEPLMKRTPAVARHVSLRPWDTGKHRVRFDSCTLHCAWAGSSQSVKSRPIRYLVLEEPDEYPAHSGSGGDPVAKALKRITTYSDKGQARVLIGGTPTTRTGNVWKRWESCAVRLHGWVPCPHCGRYQQLVWSQVKWPQAQGDRAKRAEQIEREALAWYECEHCKAKIHDHHKPAMLRRIVFASEDQVVGADGQVAGPAWKAKRIGLRISSLYSPWVQFSKLAAEWLLAQDDPGALMDFLNQRLAEPWEEQRAKTDPAAIAAKARNAGKPFELPAGTTLIIATADVQQDAMYFVVRAWSHDLRSKLLHYGIVRSWEELRRETLERSFGAYLAERLVVDAGFRKTEVDQFALQDPARINTAKGMSTYTGPIAEPRLERATGILVWNVNTMQSKDRLHSLVHDPSPSRWMPHDQVGDDYCEQMASEQKIWNALARREEWQPRTSHAANHYWDCEAMNVAIASVRGAARPEPGPTAAPVRQPETPEWLAGRPEGWTK